MLTFICVYNISQTQFNRLLTLEPMMHLSCAMLAVLFDTQYT